MGSNVRAVLDRLEQELLSRIYQLRKELVPLERELADIRHAKAALHERENSRQVQRLAYRFRDPPERHSAQQESPYGSLTMKELSLKALREHFPEGATVKQLISFFQNAWNRNDIIRSSLSPQLSRLKREGKIDRKQLVWYAIDLNKNSDPAKSKESSSLRPINQMEPDNGEEVDFLDKTTRLSKLL